MKPISHEARLHKRRAFAEVIHEYGFYVSLAFTVLFFWNLGGGKPVWIAAFVAMGIGIDYTKKTQLDLAAVTVERRERRSRKLVALVMTVFSLLAGLGSSLLRVNAVAAAQAAQADTSAIDAQIEIWQREYDVQINQVNTSTRIEWRDTSQRKADAAREEIARLLVEKKAVQDAAAQGEKTADMFSLLAQFFGADNPDGFMVMLLMLAVVSVELSIWVTAPQYWKDMLAEQEAGKRAAIVAPPQPVARGAWSRSVVRPAPAPSAAARQEQPRMAPAAAPAPAPAPSAAAPAQTVPAARGPAKPRAPRPEPVLNEKLLVVQKPVDKQGSLFD